MASISITVPDPIATRVLDGVAKTLSYDRDKLPAETKTQFAKRMIKKTVKGWVISAEADDGHTTAQATAESEIDIQD